MNYLLLLLLMINIRMITITLLELMTLVCKKKRKNEDNFFYKAFRLSGPAASFRFREFTKVNLLEKWEFSRH